MKYSKAWLAARRIALFFGLAVPGVLMFLQPVRWSHIGSLSVITPILPIWVVATLCMLGTFLSIFVKTRDIGDMIGAVIYSALLLAWIESVVKGSETSPFGIAFLIGVVAFLWSTANASVEREMGR